MSHNVRFERPKPEDINSEVARLLQVTAGHGWGLGLNGTRTPAEVGRQFNTKPSHLVEVTREYQSFARVGGLVIASSLEKESRNEIVGYALARNDVSGSMAERMAKRLFSPAKVYAWIKHVVVDGDFLNQGIGTQLVHESMRSFKPSQVPTAYIFDENQIAKNFFGRLGFVRNPADQAPKILDDYFGEDADPVEQYRYTAESVAAVLEKTA